MKLKIRPQRLFHTGLNLYQEFMVPFSKDIPVHDKEKFHIMIDHFNKIKRIIREKLKDET